MSRRTKRFLFLVLLILIGVVAAVAVVVAAKRRADLDTAELHRKHDFMFVGVALSSYTETHSHYPAARVDGHSWRIRLLPYMWSSPQYEHYRFDLPWTAEGNVDLHTRPLQGKAGAPRAWGHPYGPPLDHDPIGETPYLMVVGEDAFAHATRPRKSDEITDGLENTIAVVEVVNSSVHWLSPVDLEFDSMSFKINDGPQSISSSHPAGPMALFADGVVFRLNPEIPAETVRALCTINGGEDLSRDALVEQGLLVP